MFATINVFCSSGGYIAMYPPDLPYVDVPYVTLEASTGQCGGRQSFS